jgi:nicotinamidase/pyrazinamidase
MAAPILFWDVDTQGDFIYPAGKLYVPGAETIVPRLKRLTEWASRHQVLIVASACAHHPDDPEFAQYPPHCLVGTPGQQKIPQTQLPGALIIPNRDVELPNPLTQNRQIILEKQELSVFSNPNTERLLQALGTIREIVLYGVVTEICVAYASRELARRGYRLVIVNDAIRHLDQSAADSFLCEIGKSGGRLVGTEELLKELSHTAPAF